MTSRVRHTVRAICRAAGNAPGRLLDIAWAVQQRLGRIDFDAIEAMAGALGLAPAEVESATTFYSFLTRDRRMGKLIIRLCDGVPDMLRGAERVAERLRQALGIDFGETTADGVFSLERVAHIGLSDQAPAALVNSTVVTRLAPERIDQLVESLRRHRSPQRLVEQLGDGNNAHPMVQAMVVNNVRRAGPVLLGAPADGTALQRTLAVEPAAVIRQLKKSRLRGRGGAGFPTGMKWELARTAPDQNRYVVANADEGEPGTFKDRVLLTEHPDLLFEGMTVAGYAIGARQGILYLRGEYEYLRDYLESVLADRRRKGLLGESIDGCSGVAFDIRIQLGAGAYICGEETALLSSCEGRRGDPKTRPPFPVQHGYWRHPTVVNNVETLCCAARIMEHGPEWFVGHGHGDSAGTKLLSISGDCAQPGVYEVPLEVSLREVLKMCGGEDAEAVQVGGASGAMVGRGQLDRRIGYEDLSGGGSVIVLGAGRDLLAIVQRFTNFFIEESCGYCTPCRAGNVLLGQRLAEIRAGHGTTADIDYLRRLGANIRLGSRCGLGQMSPNPILTSLANLPAAYHERLTAVAGGLIPSFDLAAEVSQARALAGRDSVEERPAEEPLR